MPECEIFGRNHRTGERVPFAKRDWVIVSSSTSPWRDSFKVEHHLRPAYEQMEITVPQANIHFDRDSMKDPALIELRVAGSSLHTRLIQPGDVGIVPKGMPVWGRLLGPSESTSFLPGTTFLRKLRSSQCPVDALTLKPCSILKTRRFWAYQRGIRVTCTILAVFELKEYAASRSIR